jgi:uncharacterized delta-60 repeat protein
VVLASAAIAAACFVVPAHARPGDLDPAFSGDGLVRASFGKSSSAAAVAIQPDGRIVVAGQSSNKLALARYRRGGRLDRTFSGNGLVRIDLGGYSSASALVIQSDAKILVLGGSAQQGRVLARLTPSGARDPSFSGDGLLTDLGENAFADLALDGDGKIVLAGGRRPGPALVWEAVLARFRPGGAPDTSFSGDGLATVSFPEYEYGGYGEVVAVEPNGSPVLVGQATSDFVTTDAVLARFKPNGDLDPSFSGDGRNTLDIGPVDAISGVAVRSDGDIVTSGSNCSSYDDLYGSCASEVAQLNPDGSLDPSFSGNGSVVFSLRRGLYYGSATGSGPALAADGGTVVAGGTLTERQGYGLVDFALARLDPAGSLDASFRGGGIWATDFLSEYDDAYDVALQRNGKIVAVGSAGAVRSSRYERQIALARYEVKSGPRDADADGVRDRADRCPFRFGGHRGCRWYRRSLTMEFSRRSDLFRGVLKSRDANCVDGEKVRVLRARPGPDLLVDTTYTSRGRWRVDARLHPGRYYAIAPASQSTAGEAQEAKTSSGRRYGRCLKARANGFRI